MENSSHLSPRLINTGVACRNLDLVNDQIPRQIVIVGIARGATSVAAGALHKLGITLGNSAKAPVYEDRELSEAFEKGRYHEAASIIRQYDEKFSIWAWKRPDAIKYLGRVDDLLSDPFYIFIFRDIFSIANRKSISRQLEPFSEMRNALKLYGNMVDFVSRTSRPHMLVSAEKMLTKRDAFIDALIAGLRLKVSDSEREEAIGFITTDPKDYLQKTVFTHAKGFVDNLTREQIRGWAKSADHNDPVEVEIRLNDELVATVTAKGFREGLKIKGIHPEGRCEFDVDASSFLWPDEPVKVEVIVKGDIAPLRGGEAFI